MSLLGDYSSASVYFEGVVEAMNKYLKQMTDSHLRAQWQKAKRAVQEEANAVCEIDKIKASFTRPATGAGEEERRHGGFAAAKPQKAPADIPVEVLVPGDRRARDAPAQPVDDPDVWRPPTRGPPSHNPVARKHQAPHFEERRLPSWARQNGSGAPEARRRQPSSGPPKQVGSKVDCWNSNAGPSKGRKDQQQQGKANKRAESGQRPGLQDNYEGPDQMLAGMLEKDVLDNSPGVRWDDIAGLEDAKRILEEAIVWPLWSPHMFTGIRRPPKGVLLFGPPGTGKTLLAKAVATECKTTFFNISSSTLASKYRGESERMVRILFDLARRHAPSTIFIDEIDALCSSRGGDGEHEASRRVKTEFLVQIDGCNINGEDGEAPPYVMVLAATNYPWDLDEALKRRMEKRIYISLPDVRQRKELLKISLKGCQVADDVDWEELARQLEGYSGDDCSNICRDAAMNGMRRVLAGKSKEEIQAMSKSDLSEPVRMDDFIQALGSICPSVSKDNIKKHEEWMKENRST